MKMTTAYAMTWLATSIAITAGIIVTHDLSALVAFVFPYFVSFGSEKE